jgi:hypothetical protein
MIRRALLGFVAVATLVSCGTDGQPSATGSDADSTTLLPTSSVPTSSSSEAFQVKETVDLSPRLPAALKPLGLGESVPIALADAFRLISSDPVARPFFDEEGERVNAQVQVGRYVANDAGDTTESIQGLPPSEFIAYVIVGGSDVCVKSAPAGEQSDGPFPCSALVVLDAEHKSVAWVVRFDQDLLNSLNSLAPTKDN